MSFQEYLKYLTKRFVLFLETPAEERKKQKTPRESWGSRWFGAIPMSIKLLLKK